MLYHYQSVATSNSAALLIGDRVRPLEIKPTMCPHPARSPTLMLVKVGAVAINHMDVAAQVTGSLFGRHMDYALDRIFSGYTRGRKKVKYGHGRILGCDLAGEVVQVGKPDFGGIRVGDRVLALALGNVTPMEYWGCYEEAAFQEYVIVRRYLACVIPDTITYEQACVFPLTITIAAYALFHEDYLYLCPPTIPSRDPDASSDIIVITDGASSVGCHAVQLACSAGYWVYSTTSTEHFETVKQLGARRVFDCHAPHLADEILSAMREDNRTIAGAVAVGIKAVEICIRVLSKYKGGNGLRDNHKFIACIEIPAIASPSSMPMSTARCLSLKTLRKAFNIVHSRAAGVQMKPVECKDLGDHTNAITRMVFRDFLPRALASGHILPSPPPRVVGKGLDKIQEAFDILRDGVDAEKVVVSMP